MQTILFIRFSSIGDIVLCSPLLRALKQQMPNSRLLFATKKQFAPLLQHNPHIDKLFLLDKDMGTLIKALKAEPIDFIVDLHNNLRSRRLRWAIKAPSALVRKYNWQKWLLVHFKLNLMPNSHIVDRYFATLQPLGIQPDEKGLAFYNGIAEADSQALRRHLPNPYNVLVIGGTYFTKRIPLPKLIEAVKASPYPVVLIGGKNDHPMAAQLCQYFEPSVPLHNLCGNLSIAESAEIIRHSHLVISGDTGMMHIAAAYQKPLLSVWGNTVPALGFAPYMPQRAHHSLILENKELKCRPCSKLGYNKCPKKHFECMQSLDMAKAINDLMMQIENQV